MEMSSQVDRQDARQPMPIGVRWAVWLSVAALVVGAVYLLSVRGDALLLDLSALGQRIFCF
jgi:hypothetical protein